MERRSRNTLIIIIVIIIIIIIIIIICMFDVRYPAEISPTSVVLPELSITRHMAVDKLRGVAHSITRFCSFMAADDIVSRLLMTAVCPLGPFVRLSPRSRLVGQLIHAQYNNPSLQNCTQTHPCNQIKVSVCRSFVAGGAFVQYVKIRAKVKCSTSKVRAAAYVVYVPAWYPLSFTVRNLSNLQLVIRLLQTSQTDIEIAMYHTGIVQAKMCAPNGICLPPMFPHIMLLRLEKEYSAYSRCSSIVQFKAQARPPPRHCLYRV